MDNCRILALGGFVSNQSYKLRHAFSLYHNCWVILYDDYAICGTGGNNDVYCRLTYVMQVSLAGKASFKSSITLLQFA